MHVSHQHLYRWVGDLQVTGLIVMKVDPVAQILEAAPVVIFNNTWNFKTPKMDKDEDRCFFV